MKIQFPFYSRGLDKSKTIHLTVVLLAVLLPCIPVTAAFSTGGYLTAIYPLLLCYIKNPDAAYFSFAFMLSVIAAIGVPLLIITFMTTVKVLLHPCKVLHHCSSFFSFISSGRKILIHH